MRKQMTGKATIRGAVTRPDVLSCAAVLFARRGFRATNLELVAERLGVTRQALYYHFHSKAEILGALFDDLMTKLETRALAVTAGLAADPAVQFEELIRGHLEVALDNLDLVALLIHEQPELLRLDWLHVAARRREYAEVFADAFEQGTDAGVLRAADPWIAANTVLAAMNGVCLWKHGEGGPVPARVDIAGTLPALLAQGVLLDSVLARPSPPGRRRIGGSWMNSRSTVRSDPGVPEGVRAD
jgi:AcrR family transcriptional regulator